MTPDFLELAAAVWPIAVVLISAALAIGVYRATVRQLEDRAAEDRESINHLDQLADAHAERITILETWRTISDGDRAEIKSEMKEMRREIHELTPLVATLTSKVDAILEHLKTS